MVKTLSYLCKECVAKNLRSLPNAHQAMPPALKEQILEWLGDHSHLTPEYIPFVNRHVLSDRLKHISFYACDQVTDSFLELIGRKTAGNLLTIRLNRCRKLTDAGIVSVTRGQSRLQVLQLRRQPQLTDVALSHVGPADELRLVDITSCEGFSDKGIVGLLIRCRNIEELFLHFCTKLTSDCILGSLDASKRKLRKLYLSYTKIPTDEALSNISRNCRHLNILQLRECFSFTSQGLSQISSCCTELKELDVGFCDVFSKHPHSACLTSLPTTLTSLSLCGIQLMDQTLFVGIITRLPKLRGLQLNGLVAVNHKTMDEILSVVGSHIEKLDLSGPLPYVTDDCLEAISRHCTALADFRIQLNISVTCLPLLPLLRDPRRAEQIKLLMLSCKKLDVSVIEAVADHCTELDHLDVSGVQFIDDDLLHRLCVGCSRITYLSLKGCRQISDLGVCDVAERLPLNVLCLSGIPHLTDRGVISLANSQPQLHELYISGCTKISQQAVNYITDCCHRRLHVVHRIPNADPDLLMARDLKTGEYIRVDNLPFDRM